MQKLAPLNRRILAYFVDFNLLSCTEMLLLLIVHKDLRFLLFIPSVLYFSFTVSSKWQSTLGQRIMGIYVARLDKKPIDFLLAFDRYISQLLIPIIIFIFHQFAQLIEELKVLFSVLAIFVNILFILWYLLALYRSDRKTVHDIIFGTIVVEGRL